MSVISSGKSIGRKTCSGGRMGGGAVDVVCDGDPCELNVTCTVYESRA